MMIENMNMFNILSPSHLPACHSSYSPQLTALPRFLSPNYVQIVQINTFLLPLSRKWCGISSGGVWRLLALPTFNVVNTPLTTALDTIVIIVYKADFHTLMLNVVCPSVSL